MARIIIERGMLIEEHDIPERLADAISEMVDVYCFKDTRSEILEVGDVVSWAGTNAVVVNISESKCLLLTKNGAPVSVSAEAVKKTGKHLDDIDRILEIL